MAVLVWVILALTALGCLLWVILLVERCLVCGFELADLIRPQVGERSEEGEMYELQ